VQRITITGANLDKSHRFNRLDAATADAALSSAMAFPMSPT